MKCAFVPFAVFEGGIWCRKVEGFGSAWKEQKRVKDMEGAMLWPLNICWISMKIRSPTVRDSPRLYVATLLINLDLGSSTTP